MPFWDIGNKNNKTFKYKKKDKKDSLRHQYKLELKNSIKEGSKSLKDAVKLKEGANLNEWISMNTIEAFNTLSTVINFVGEKCSKDTCPKMAAGSRYQYLWAEEGSKTPTELDAPAYIIKLLSWVASMLDDESIFPTNGNYGKKFLPTVKKILSRLFRVYAHIYYQHLDAVEAAGAKENLHTCFRHYYYFISEFELVGEKEMLPLQPLIEQLSKTN